MGLPCRSILRLCCCALFLSAFSSAQTASSSEESDVFHRARAQSAPEDRIKALTLYLNQFPSGSHSAIARELLLKTYLNAFPDRTVPIHALASALIATAPAGIERWEEEARAAGLLASAKPNGADLPDAQTWSQAALDSLTETAYRRESAAAGVRYKLPKLTPHQVHEQFLGYRASFLATAAHVAFDLGQTDRATKLLSEAAHLNPLSPEADLLGAQIALAGKQSEAALAFYERADALGALDAGAHDDELKLLKTLNPGGTPEALDQQVDKIYRTLYPPLYSLAPRQLPPGGHTVLLELLSGTGCAPCVAPDLAVESLLTTYSRQDLAVLEFDEHIPRPDPLTTPGSVARAAFYNAETTPEAFLDGQPLQILGSSRTDVENVVVSFADAIEAEAAFPSGLHLTASASRSASGNIQASITLAASPVPNAKPDETTGDTSLRALGRAQLFAALVADNIRYSGENGIRFHHMVVRSLQGSPALNFLGSSPHSFTFSPASVESANTAYLTTYESTNDRFGAFAFPNIHFPLGNAPLAIVVWVQDQLTRNILQTTYAPVPSI